MLQSEHGTTHCNSTEFASPHVWVILIHVLSFSNFFDNLSLHNIPFRLLFMLHLNENC